MRKGTLAMCLAVAAAGYAGSAAKAVVVFGNFEGGQSDGFGSWNNGVVPFAADVTTSTYSYSTTGATLGDTALHVTHSGFAQNLAFDFKASGFATDFLANDIISFDVTVPASTTNSGFWQVYAVALNAPGAGFVNVAAGASGAPYYNLYPPYSGQTGTVSFNYDAYKANIGANPGYLQMVIAINDGSGAPPDFYFDNFRLSAAPPVPEPGTAGLLGLGGLGLLARRRR